jgi:hypothetical protein
MVISRQPTKGMQMLRVTFKSYMIKDLSDRASDAVNIMQNIRSGSGTRVEKGTTGLDNSLDLVINENIWSTEDKRALYDLIEKNTGVSFGHKE